MTSSGVKQRHLLGYVFASRFPVPGLHFRASSIVFGNYAFNFLMGSDAKEKAEALKASNGAISAPPRVFQVLRDSMKQEPQQGGVDVGYGCSEGVARPDHSGALQEAVVDHELRRCT